MLKQKYYSLNQVLPNKIGIVFVNWRCAIHALREEFTKCIRVDAKNEDSN